MMFQARTVFALAVACLLPSMAFADFSFVSGGSGSAGTEPSGMVIADLNQDGRLDVLAANDSVATVSALLSSGKDQYLPPVGYFTGWQGRFFHQSQQLASGDFNGDGHLDFAATSQYGAFHVSISLGVGNGTFLDHTSFETGICPTSVAAIDVNHDGKLDLLVANSEGSDISVLLGDGDGAFLPKVNFPLPAYPISIIAADFNRDGNPDVGVVGLGGFLWVLSGLGNGQFAPVVSYPVGTNSRALVAADFNRDGFLDVAVANGGRGSISVLRGFGDGTFAPAVEYPISAVGLFHGEADSIVAADLNSDGNLDLAVADFLGGAIVVFRGHRNGIFDSAQFIPTADSPSTVGAADFDGNGSIDLAVLNYGSGTVSVLLNDVVFDDPFE
jgi:hypothetical protein